MVKYLICIAVGYCVGMLNPAYVISKMKGFDIRKRGSGNAGATNALLTMGKFIGIGSMIFDITKCILVIILMRHIYPGDELVYPVTGVACMIGHIYPALMGFKGGKGLACLGGIIIFFDWRVFCVMLIILVGLAFLVNYPVVVPLVGSLAFPIVYWKITGHVQGMIILFFGSIVLFLQHIENLQRIKNGTEIPLSYLWNKEEKEKAKEVITTDKK